MFDSKQSAAAEPDWSLEPEEKIRPWLRWAWWGFWGAMGMWLFLAACFVSIEYYDGMDSILVARYLLGEIPDYTSTRGPLMGLLLLPAEWIKQSNHQAHPLDFTLHHLTMGVLHVLYLVGIVRIVRSRFGAGWPVWLALVSAVPTFMFFTYGPFVSHDILPGVFFLGMLHFADRFHRDGGWKSLVWLGVLGAAVALIKHTYALFFVLVVGAAVIRWLVKESSIRRLGLLLGSAALAGAVVYLVLCSVTHTVFPNDPWILRGWRQTHYLFFDATGENTPHQPWWVYIRNFPAYGFAAMVLIGPAIAWALKKGDAFQRSVAGSWVFTVVLMHLLEMKQVRYLICLAPLTVVLLIPVIRILWATKGGRWAFAVVLLGGWLPLHVYSPLKEASRIIRPFYRTSETRQLLQPLQSPSGFRNPVLLNWNMLSYSPSRKAPLPGDIYHDLFHFGVHHLRGFYGYNGPDDLVGMSAMEMGRLEDWPAKAALSIVGGSGGILLQHTTPFRQHPRGKFGLEQQMFVAGTVTVRFDQGKFYLEQGRNRLPLESGIRQVNQQPMLVLKGDALRNALAQCLVIRAVIPGFEGSQQIVVVAADTFAIPAIRGIPKWDKKGLKPFQLMFLRRESWFRYGPIREQP